MYELCANCHKLIKQLSIREAQIVELKQLCGEWGEIATGQSEQITLQREEIARLTKGGCGLPGHTTATGDEGTAFCITCEQAARLDEAYSSNGKTALENVRLLEEIERMQLACSDCGDLEGAPINPDVFYKRWARAALGRAAAGRVWKARRVLLPQESTASFQLRRIAISWGIAYEKAALRAAAEELGLLEVKKWATLLACCRAHTS